MLVWQCSSAYRTMDQALYRTYVRYVHSAYAPYHLPMARLRYWLLVALLATACGSTSEETATTTTTTTENVSTRAQGFWLLETFATGGERHEVEVGGNTATEAWVEIGDEAIQANTGCNKTGREIIRWTENSVTISGGFSTEMLCGDERVMEVEHLLQGMMANEPIQIEVDGDTMIWTSEDTQLVFRSIPASPETTAASTSTIVGTWLLEAVHTADSHMDVGIGVNAAEQPWVEIDTADVPKSLHPELPVTAAVSISTHGCSAALTPMPTSMWLSAV